MKSKQFKALCLVLATTLTLSASGCKIVTSAINNLINPDEESEEIDSDELSADDQKEKEKIEEALAKIAEEENKVKEDEERDLDEEDFDEEDIDDEDIDDEEDADDEEIIDEYVVTLSSDWIGSNVTQEDLDAECAEKGYESVTLNPDGSVTYVMTENQHDKMMGVVVDEIQKEIDDIVNDKETFKNIVGFEGNGDFTRMTVTTTSDYESLVLQIDSILFFYFGEQYNAFNGTPTTDIEVTWVDEDGNVFTSFNLNEEY